MTKVEQFLWCVQTAFLNNQLLLLGAIQTAETAEFEDIRHVHTVCGRALWAASKIPPSLSVDEAAREFCGYAFNNLWYEGKACPEWLVGMPK